MKKIDKHTIVIKKIGEKLDKRTEIHFVSKQEALDYVDTITDDEIIITIFDDHEKIIFSKTKTKNAQHGFGVKEHHNEHHNEHHYNHNNHHNHHNHDDDDDDSYA